MSETNPTTPSVTKTPLAPASVSSGAGVSESSLIESVRKTAQTMSESLERLYGKNSTDDPVIGSIFGSLTEQIYKKDPHPTYFDADDVAEAENQLAKKFSTSWWRSINKTCWTTEPSPLDTQSINGKAGLFAELAQSVYARETLLPLDVIPLGCRTIRQKIAYCFEFGLDVQASRLCNQLKLLAFGGVLAAINSRRFYAQTYARIQASLLEEERNFNVEISATLENFRNQLLTKRGIRGKKEEK